MQNYDQDYGEWQGEQRRETTGERLSLGLGWFSIGLGLAEVFAPGAVAQLIGVQDNERTRGILRFYGIRELGAGIGILSQPTAPAWLWGRVAGDLLDLSTLAAALNADATDRTRLAAASAAVVGVTALDLVCAQRLSQDQTGHGTTKSGASRVVKTVSINRSPEEVYQFWRNFENLPRFMNHLEAVHTMDDRRSHWIAKAPAGRTVEWDAEIVADQPNSLISWRSLEGADVDNSGSVRFERATGGRGAVVRVELEYTPPAGALGSAIAKLFWEEPGQQLDDDLRALKQVMETGEIVRSDASIHTGMHPAQPSR